MASTSARVAPGWQATRRKDISFLLRLQSAEGPRRTGGGATLGRLFRSAAAARISRRAKLTFIVLLSTTAHNRPQRTATPGAHATGNRTTIWLQQAPWPQTRHGSPRTQWRSQCRAASGWSVCLKRLDVVWVRVPSTLELFGLVVGGDEPFAGELCQGDSPVDAPCVCAR